MINGIIYQAINKINNKKYIGYATTTLARRKAMHKCSAKRGSKNHFHKGLRKWGIDNFEWNVIQKNVSDIDLLKRFEKNYIALLRPEYNETAGGEGSHGFKMPIEAIEKTRLANLGSKRSEETRLKMSLARKGKKLLEGTIDKLRNRHFSPEHRRKIGLAHKGKVVSEEQRKKISKGLTGKVQSQETVNKRISKTIGKKRSPEFCEFIRKRNLGRKQSEETKKKISDWNKQNPQKRGLNGKFEISE